LNVTAPSSRTITGALLVVLLAVGLLFIGAKRTQHPGSAPPPTQAAQSARPSSAPPTVGVAIPGCYNSSVPPADRPTKLNVVGCASTAVALQDMSWSSWGPDGADGTGSAVFKICQPNCATGYQLTDQVIVHAWNPQLPRANSDCPAGLRVFADLILAFPKGAPPPTAQELNARYRGLPAAHYTNYSVANPHDGEFIGYTFCS
jgi:hypothetical protein